VRIVLVATLLWLLAIPRADAQVGEFYLDSPLSTPLTLPTDGTPTTYSLGFDLFEFNTMNFFFWEIETIGQVSIQEWIGMSSADCRNTPDLCSLESTVEFALGTVDARISGSGGRGATGFAWTDTPFGLGTITIVAGGPGYVRLKSSIDSCPVVDRRVTLAVAPGACNDGIDNDRDGFTDFPADPGCADSLSVTESPSCNDGIDNDEDGATDFPQDSDCLSASDATELPEADATVPAIVALLGLAAVRTQSTR